MESSAAGYNILGCQNGWDQCGALPEAIRRSAAKVTVLRDEYLIAYISLLRTKGQVFHGMSPREISVSEVNEVNNYDRERLFVNKKLRWMAAKKNHALNTLYGLPFRAPKHDKEDLQVLEQRGLFSPF